MKLRLLGIAPKLFFLCAFFFLNTKTYTAGSIDATTNVNFQSTSYTFADSEFARGFVRLDQGLTANGLLNLNVLFPVAGAINIDAAGKLVLDGDLTLASNVTIPNGGEINGQNHTLFLQGDLTIPANKTLKISGNLTIDGQGHNLIFADEALLVIDDAAATKLTIRNTKLKALKNNPISGPSIQFGDALNQKLVLNDSDILLGGDFTFEWGALDIVNTVNFKGDFWIFEYASTYNLTIKKNSKLFMDIGFYFFYNPTDNKQTHIAMQDLTSQLFLNGCVFYTSGLTGLKLTKGHLLIDHSVIFTNLSPTTKDKGLIFGNGNAAYDLEIDIFPGASIDVSTGFLTYKNAKN